MSAGVVQWGPLSYYAPAWSGICFVFHSKLAGKRAAFNRANERIQQQADDDSDTSSFASFGSIDEADLTINEAQQAAQPGQQVELEQILQQQAQEEGLQQQQQQQEEPGPELLRQQAMNEKNWTNERKNHELVLFWRTWTRTSSLFKERRTERKFWVKISSY